MNERQIFEYERGFLAMCESYFDHAPKPVCPHDPSSVEAKAWADGVVEAREILSRLDLNQPPEVF